MPATLHRRMVTTPDRCPVLSPQRSGALCDAAAALRPAVWTTQVTVRVPRALSCGPRPAACVRSFSRYVNACGGWHLDGDSRASLAAGLTFQRLIPEQPQPPWRADTETTWPVSLLRRTVCDALRVIGTDGGLTCHCGGEQTRRLLFATGFNARARTEPICATGSAHRGPKSDGSPVCV